MCKYIAHAYRFVSLHALVLEFNLTFVRVYVVIIFARCVYVCRYVGSVLIALNPYMGLPNLGNSHTEMGKLKRYSPSVEPHVHAIAQVRLLATASLARNRRHTRPTAPVRIRSSLWTSRQPKRRGQAL